MSLQRDNISQDDIHMVDLKDKEHIQLDQQLKEDPTIVSDADRLSLWQTLRAYPRATFFCAFAAFGAISDGYQYALPGSIVALPGFINQFGSINAKGVFALDSQHVALWGGESWYTHQS